MKPASSLILAAMFGSCTLVLLGTDRCGDGVVSEREEACDDSNRDSGDGCDSSCSLEPGFSCPTPGAPCLPDSLCGDGLLEAPEQCDDANNSNTDACIDCQLASCGDGFIQTGVETCEPPNSDECNAQCQRRCDLPADCADDNLCTENENCVNNACVNTAVVPDDGDQCTADVCDPDLGILNTVQNDGFLCDVSAGRDICLAGDCVASACGDGFEDEGNGEQCDDGNGINTDDCPNDCTPALCGDGSIEGTETCDDGDVTPGDGCDQNCQLEIACGNNVLNAGEQCDDGNTTNGDGCSELCLDEVVVDCAADPLALQSALLAAVDGDRLVVLNGAACSYTNLQIDITGVRLSLLGLNQAVNMSVRLTTNTNASLTADNVSFRNQFQANDSSIALITNSSFNFSINNGLLIVTESASVGVSNTTFTNSNNGGSAQSIFCNSSAAKFVADRITVQNNSGEEMIRVNNGCPGIIANSLFINNPNARQTIQVEGGGRLNLISSTFADTGEESGVLFLGGGGSECRIESIVATRVGTDPISSQGAANILAVTSFIPGENILGVSNIDPALNASFRITNAQVLGQANPNPPGVNLFFDPSTIFPGLDLFDHDFNNVSRPQGARDPGAFEEP